MSLRMPQETFSPLSSVRLGAVQYLNAKPLVCGIEENIVFKHPSLLADDFFCGKLDVALIPIFTVFDQPGVMVADGIAIAAAGPVYSVILAYRGKLADIRRVCLDPASRTSTHLVQVICRRFLQLEPEFSGAEAQENDARLLIGNQAIQFRHLHDTQWEYLDLGEAWMRFTGLPFVFAVWAMRPGNYDPGAVAEALRAVKENGKRNIEAITDRLPPESRAFATRYLTEHIRFDLGEMEKKGIRAFASYLKEQKFIPRGEELRYI